MSDDLEKMFPTKEFIDKIKKATEVKPLCVSCTHGACVTEWSACGRVMDGPEPKQPSEAWKGDADEPHSHPDGHVQQTALCSVFSKERSISVGFVLECSRYKKRVEVKE